MEAMLIGAGIQAGSGILAYLLSLPDREEAMRLIKKSMDETGRIQVPVLEKMVAQQIGPSALADVRADPEAIANQRASMNALSQIADQGGFTLADRAVQNKVIGAANHQAANSRAQIMDSMAARGVGGSGAELALQQQAAQHANQTANQNAMDLAGQAQARALDAIMRRGQMAGQMRGQDWSEKSQAAQAADAIERYNAEARARAQAGNVNQQQWGYDAILRKQAAVNGTRGAQANALQHRADDTQNMVAGAGGGVGQGVGAFGAEEEKNKRDELKAAEQKKRDRALYGIDY